MAGAVHDQNIVLIDAQARKRIAISDPKPNVRRTKTDELINAERPLLVISSRALEPCDLEFFRGEAQALDAAAWSRKCGIHRDALKYCIDKQYSKIFRIAKGVTMCGGVEISGRYTQTGEQLKIYFPNPRAALPVLGSESQEVIWVPWGRRREQSGKGPAGGWARQSSIEEGRWEKYRPTRVRIPAERFMEKDEGRVSHWFDLEAGQTIEGLVIGDGDQQRVYVITTEAPPDQAWVHDRWPSLTKVGP
ncbi:hypothetical protein D3C77_375230 [compost metagenome]